MDYEAWLRKYDRNEYWLTEGRWKKLAERMPRARWTSNLMFCKWNPFDDKLIHDGVADDGPRFLFAYHKAPETFSFRRVSGYRHVVAHDFRDHTPLDVCGMLRAFGEGPGRLEEMEF